MSRKEVDRLGVIQAVAGRQLKQATAAQRLGLTVRQIKRLVRRYRQEGAPGLISRHRLRRPNNAWARPQRRAILDLVRTRYADFGPTLACEKLCSRHGYRLSRETLRQWMMADGLWAGRSRKTARIHQRRPRRACLGELVQIDGSPHDWFEGRAGYCSLIVFIDDATSRLMALHFAPAETTEAYMRTLGVYLHQHGRPVALYSDRHSIFRLNRPDREGELTQFTRALRTLRGMTAIAFTRTCGTGTLDSIAMTGRLPAHQPRSIYIVYVSLITSGYGGDGRSLRDEGL